MPPDDLVESLLRVTLGALRHERRQRRREIEDWHTGSALATFDNAVDRDAMTKAVVSTLAARLRLPLKLSRFRSVTAHATVALIGTHAFRLSSLQITDDRP